MKRAFERLIEYTVFETASDAMSVSYPSTVGQLVFGEFLAAELKEIGLVDARLNEYGYVYATIPANIPNWSGKRLGLCAHMDVVIDPPAVGIKPRIIENYAGGDICLNEALGIFMSTAAYPVLNDMAGRCLIVTDGTTILGADDKAGVAEIVTAAEILMAPNAPPHGEIKICFTPDEEIGTGTLHLDPKDFGCDFAYTCDGGAFGGIQYETFNAASAKITFSGISAHPGYAKDVMKNAARIATEFDCLVPQDERPEVTDGYDGFYHLTGMKGSVESAELSYILRDHDAAVLQNRKAKILEIAALLNEKYGDGAVTAAIEDSYRNMGEVIKDHSHLVDAAAAAIRAAGREPVIRPVRGGTDGSNLSFMDIPCPNIGDGSYNVHSRMEFVCAEEMDSCVEVILSLATYYTTFCQ